MGLISDFRRRRDIDAYASHLAALFIKRLPPERSSDQKRFDAEFEILLGHVQGYQRKESLGVLGKSRLLNKLQWQLIEQGYPGDKAKEIGYALASRLTASRLTST